MDFSRAPTYITFIHFRRLYRTLEREKYTSRRFNKAKPNGIQHYLTDTQTLLSNTDNNRPLMSKKQQPKTFVSDDDSDDNQSGRAAVSSRGVPATTTSTAREKFDTDSESSDDHVVLQRVRPTLSATRGEDDEGTTVLVRRLDNQVQRVPVSDIEPGPARDYLKVNREQQGKECRYGDGCASKETCSFVHFRESRDGARSAAASSNWWPFATASRDSVMVRRGESQATAVPVAELKETEGLHFLLNVRPGATGSECRHGLGCLSGQKCKFIHFRNEGHGSSQAAASARPPPYMGAPATSVPAPPPPQSQRTPAPWASVPPAAARVTQLVGIVVDGYWVAMRSRWSIEIFNRMSQAAAQFISSQLPNPGDTAAIHPDARVVFFPSSVDAQSKGIIDDAKALQTMRFCEMLKEHGWQVQNSKFKQSAGRWVAAEEDVRFSNACTQLCRNEGLEPMGANPTKGTLAHLVLVTGDSDHDSTLRYASNKELRWLLSPAESGIHGALVERAQLIGRLIPFDWGVASGTERAGAETVRHLQRGGDAAASSVAVSVSVPPRIVGAWGDQRPSRSELFRVKRTDGTIQDFAPSRLLDNPALVYLRSRPAATAKECNNTLSHDAMTCTFVHIRQM